jgi:hypothetical protein
MQLRKPVADDAATPTDDIGCFIRKPVDMDDELVVYLFEREQDFGHFN